MMPLGAAVRRGSVLRRASSLLLGVMAIGAVVTPASAATVTYATAPLDSYNVKGIVFATLVVGGTVYVGGDFDEVKHKGVAYGYTNLAAFDVATGDLVPTFAPNPNKEVRSLAVDGSSLFVGGKFTSIGGAWRTRLAKVDLASGIADATFNASAGARVDALATDGSRLFAGGQFSVVNGVARDHIAAVDATTGALDTWDPAASGSVLALALSPDGSTIYTGGSFSTIAGTNRTRLVALSTSTGLAVGNDFQSADASVKSLDLDDDGSMLFTGDVANDLEAFSVATGSRLWRNTAPQGDVQATHYASGNVYIGFHDGADGLASARLAAVDAVTGATETWNPTFSSTYGVFAIDSTPSQLVIGGEFWVISGVAQDGVAVFPLAS